MAMAVNKRLLWILVIGLMGLAACSGAPESTPTPPPTQTARVITATFLPPTPTPTVTTTPIYLVVTSTPTVTPPPTEQDQGIIASPTATDVDLGIVASRTPTPTVTPLALIQPAGAQPPSPTAYPTSAGIAIAEAPSQPQAQVCATCGGLRLRESPGTAGTVLAFLDAGTALRVTGRTADSAWIEIVTPDGTRGWIAAEYAMLNVNLSQYNITGEVANAAPANTGSTGSGSAASGAVLLSDAPALPAGAPDMARIVTGISARSRQIFLDGQSKGNIFNVFVAVGDSITDQGAFMTQFTNGRYNLGAYNYYGPAVSWWNSVNGRGQLTFDPDHLAAAAGWSTFDVLDPGLGWPGICADGETPLHCTYRVDRPSVALIMLGTNDAGGIAPADYEANMRRILNETISMGIIPVLSTLPPRVDAAANNNRVDAYNGIIVNLAREYDIPLWNYSLALSGLPNNGLDSDGVHPSKPPDNLFTTFDAEHLQYGFPMRNLTALHVLDQLWRQVLYDGGTIPVGDPATSPNQTIPAAPADPAPADPAPAQPADSGGYTCAGAPPPRLTVGQTGRVTPGVPNKLRAQPSVNAVEVGSIPGEAQFTVIGGPTCADSYTWWQVDYQGAVGWTASGTASEYWVEP
jgi:uncharacterized protein YraI